MTTAGGGGATGGEPPASPLDEGRTDPDHADGRTDEPPRPTGVATAGTDPAHADGRTDEPPRPTGVATAGTDPARLDAAWTDAARPEPAWSGAAPPDPAWPVPAGPDAGRPDRARPEPRPWWPRPAGPRYASWASRVVAHLLDVAVLGTVTYLAFAVQPVTAPDPAPFFAGGSGSPAPPGGWWESPWVVLTVLVLTLMQACVGSTPGKLVLGIAVVRDADGRPAGLVRTVARWFAHLLDALVYVGYLRPLWHVERRTFADSLLSTVVVRREDARGPAWWSGGLVRACVAASVVVCVAGAGFQLGPYSVTSSGATTSDCMIPGTDGSPGPGGGGSVRVQSAGGPVSRWGVVRRQLQAGGGVEVRWERTGAVAAPGAYRLQVARPDGSGSRTFQVDVVSAAADGTSELANQGAPIEDFWLEEATVVARFAPGTFDELGDRWEWTLTSDARGVVTGPCTGTAERWGDA